MTTDGITRTMFESCMEIRRYFSDHLEGACESDAVRSMRFHLNYCVACRQELDRWETLQADLRYLPRHRVPPELALRLRVLLSQRLHRNPLGLLLVHLENGLRPLLLPASAGVLTAIICFGLILGTGVPPVSNIPDVPLRIVTPPRVKELAPINFSAGDQPVVLVTFISAAGRVKDYKVLSGAPSRELTHQLDRILFFSLFQPATTLGKPTDGEVVLSLRRITVRG